MQANDIQPGARVRAIIEFDVDGSRFKDGKTLVVGYLGAGFNRIEVPVEQCEVIIGRAGYGVKRP